MANFSVVQTGCLIQLYINNVQYKEVADISFTVSYGEEAIYGIDSIFPQEIAGGQIMVSGDVRGYRISNSGGLQAKGMRPLFTDMSAAPYISLRVTDRKTSEDIIFIPQCKVTAETHDIPAKGTYKLNFSFKGMIPLFVLDRQPGQSSIASAISSIFGSGGSIAGLPSTSSIGGGGVPGAGSNLP